MEIIDDLFSLRLQLDDQSKSKHPIAFWGV